MLTSRKMIVGAALLSLFPAISSVCATSAPLVAQLAPPPVFVPVAPPKTTTSPVPLPVPAPAAPQSDKVRDQAAIEARVLLMFAAAAEDDGRTSDAITMYKQVLAVSKKTMQPGVDAAVASGRLGALYADLRKYTDSLTYAKLALATFEKLEGPVNNEVGIQLNNIGWVQEKAGQKRDAENSFKQALSVLRASADESDDLIAVAENNLGDLYMLQHRYPEAVKLYGAASNDIRNFYGPSHPATRMMGHKLLRAKRLAGSTANHAR